MKNIFLILRSILFLSLFTLSQADVWAASSLSLKDLIQTRLEEKSIIQKSYYKTEEIREQKNISKAGFLPEETMASGDHGPDQMHTADEHAADSLAGKENFTTVDHGQIDEEVLNMSSAQGDTHSSGSQAQDWVSSVEDPPTTSFDDNSGKSWTQEVETDHGSNTANTDNGNDKAGGKPFESTGEEHVADTDTKGGHGGDHHG